MHLILKAIVFGRHKFMPTTIELVINVKCCTFELSPKILGLRPKIMGLKKGHIFGNFMEDFELYQWLPIFGSFFDQIRKLRNKKLAKIMGQNDEFRFLNKMAILQILPFS